MLLKPLLASIKRGITRVQSVLDLVILFHPFIIIIYVCFSFMFLRPLFARCGHCVPPVMLQIFEKEEKRKQILKQQKDFLNLCDFREL